MNCEQFRDSVGNAEPRTPWAPEVRQHFRGCRFCNRWAIDREARLCALRIQGREKARRQAELEREREARRIEHLGPDEGNP